MQKFPEQLLRERPSLNLIYGWALLLSGLPLPKVESRMQQMYQEEQFDQGTLVGLEAYLAVLQDGPNQTEVLLQSLQTLPPDDLFMRSLAACSLGLYTMDNDPAQASRMLAEAASLTQEAGEVFASVLLLYLQSGAYLLSGRLCAAQTILQRALELATDPKGLQPIAGLPLVGLGLVAWERNELDEAIYYLTKGIPLADQYRGTMAFVEGYVTLAKVRLARGDIQDVCAALGEAQRFAKELGSPLLTHQIEAVWAELALRQGNLAAARNWVDEQMTIHLDDFPRQAGHYYEGACAIQLSIRIWRVWARVLIADGKYARAIALLDEMLTDAQRRGMNQKLIEVEMLRSLAFQAGGELEQDEHAAPLIEPLSAREREVLQLLEKGLSNREVAEHLVISLSTVKSHTASIFTKLDVHSRARAVTRARDLSIFVT
jgi:LuxR family maltose regulon positive regulatory protein